MKYTNADLGNPDIYGMTIVGNYLYATDKTNNRIIRIDLSSDTINTSWETLPNQSYFGMAATSDALFVSQEHTDTIHKIPLSAPENNISNFATGFNNPYSIAIDGTTGYVADYNNDDISTFDTASGGAKGAFGLSSIISRPYAIALLGDYVFVSRALGYLNTIQAIHKTNKTNDYNITIASGEGVYSLFAHGSYLYAGSDTGNKIYRITPTQGSIDGNETAFITMSAGAAYYNAMAVWDDGAASSSSSTSSSSSSTASTSGGATSSASGATPTQQNGVNGYIQPINYNNVTVSKNIAGDGSGAYTGVRTISWSGAYTPDMWFEIYYRGNLVYITEPNARVATIDISEYLSNTRNADGFTICAVNTLGSSCSPAPLLSPWGVGIFLAGLFGVAGLVGWRRRGKQ